MMSICPSLPSAPPESCPPRFVHVETPGMSAARFENDLPVGIASITSRVITDCWATLCVSTIGDAALTVMVSETSPTRMSALTVAVKPVESSIPSRLTVLNPGRVKVTTYTPGLRSTMLYSPWPSVTTVRTFSISAGLEASTVTPGRTRPVASRTTPAMLLDCWAAAARATSSAQRTRHARLPTKTLRTRLHIRSSFERSKRDHNSRLIHLDHPGRRRVLSRSFLAIRRRVQHNHCERFSERAYAPLAVYSVKSWSDFGQVSVGSTAGP